jgi:AcrR family transcriptional regulator
MGELILTKARELFFSHGLKSISMDDLARMAGVSKKTIYQSFADKNELVNTIVGDLIQCHYELFKVCQQTAKDPVDEVLMQANAPFETWASVNPGFFFELEKFFPHVWLKLEEHKQKVLLPGITQNLERGKAEGYYRSDIDTAFAADIRICQLANSLQPHLLTSQRMGVSQLMQELTIFYLHGITTEKGKKLLNKYLKNRNEDKRIK